MDTMRIGLQGSGERLGRCVGLHCSSWVACVPHTQLAFPPCYWPSFCDGPITLMVALALMGMASPEVTVVLLFSFVCFLCLFVIRAGVSLLVPHVGFCIDLGFVDQVLVVVWLSDV